MLRTSGDGMAMVSGVAPRAFCAPRPMPASPYAVDSFQS